MSIFRGSRYEGTNVTGVRDSSGTVRAFLHNRVSVTQDDIGSNFIIHTVKEGEDLDLLAFRFGGKSRLWWVIADINEIPFSFDIQIGQEILIPTRSVFQKFS